MKKFTLLVVLLQVLTARLAAAQENPTDFKRHAIYLEGGGQGLLYSINYDYRFAPHASVRAGFTTWSMPPLFVLLVGKFTYTSFPIMFNYLTGEGNRHLELGAGVMPAFFSLEGVDVFFGTEYEDSGSAVLGTITIGYRSQPLKGGFLFRAGLTPVFTLRDIAISGAVSLGIAF